MPGQRQGAEMGEDAEIKVPEDAVTAAAELARAVRLATADLPFGAEPLDFLVARDALAAGDDAEAAA